MDEGTIKTPNPKCHLHWYLIEFIDYRDTVSHVDIFDPSCVLLPLYLLSEPPLPKVNVQYVQTVCGCGGVGVGGVELCCRPYSAGV
jgi:hypothetical protein